MVYSSKLLPLQGFNTACHASVWKSGPQNLHQQKICPFRIQTVWFTAFGRIQWEKRPGGRHGFPFELPIHQEFPVVFPRVFSIDLPRPQPRATTSSCCRVRCPWSRPSAPAAPRAPPKGRCWTHRPPGYGCSIYSLMTLGFHGFSWWFTYSEISCKRGWHYLIVHRLGKPPKRPAQQLGLCLERLFFSRAFSRKGKIESHNNAWTMMFLSCKLHERARTVGSLWSRFLLLSQGYNRSFAGSPERG